MQFEWMDEIISRNNLIEETFIPIVHSWKEGKNISLMHVPSSSYQLELLNLGVNKKREMFQVCEYNTDAITLTENRRIIKTLLCDTVWHKG